MVEREEAFVFEQARSFYGWHALYTRYQHEKAVANHLSGRGFEVYLPLYPVLHRWKDRTKRVLLPLYPCYVFMKGGLDRKLDIVSTPGLFSIVGTAHGPSAIPDSEIEAVRQILAGPAPVEPYPYLRFGDRVRVVEGPLEGIEGILVRQKSSFRIVLSVELLKKSIAVEVDERSVERVGKFRVARIPGELRSPVLVGV